MRACCSREYTLNDLLADMEQGLDDMGQPGTHAMHAYIPTSQFILAYSDAPRLLLLLWCLQERVG